jgi:hypothetical protein
VVRRVLERFVRDARGALAALIAYCLPGRPPKVLAPSVDSLVRPAAADSNWVWAALVWPAQQAALLRQASLRWERQRQAAPLQGQSRAASRSQWRGLARAPPEPVASPLALLRSGSAREKSWAAQLLELAQASRERGLEPPRLGSPRRVPLAVPQRGSAR